jgi:DNA (cytosine-5)-methyltransferase 1
LEREEPLSWEELRYNREAKTHHTVYNNMEFPDPVDKPVRTVTATCTRVSRESIIVPDEGNFRRLSVRERGVLQGFPITYEFLGGSYASKIKMIGNAIPPVFTYYLAQAMLGTPLESLIPLDEVECGFVSPQIPAVPTQPDTAGKKYPNARAFKFAIPHLRFKSGTRFELSNSKGAGDWMIRFYFGDSKRILSLDLDAHIAKRVTATLRKQNPKIYSRIGLSIKKDIPRVSATSLQSVWAGKEQGLHPFDVLDELGNVASKLISLSDAYDDMLLEEIVKAEATVIDPRKKLPIAAGKLQKFAREIVCGILLGCHFNAKIKA